jgi:pimeloyl-ACP methyl ester carboxylesterase
VEGEQLFTVDLPPVGPETHEPLLVLHGFPTSSFDFHLVLPALNRGRRLLCCDLLGFGLSSKPDRRYSIELQADLVTAWTAGLDLSEVALLTHDMGDTVGGELLARQQEGAWPLTVTRRVLSNGSIYIEMAQLSAGQQLLLSLPDERLGPDPLMDRSALGAALTGTFSPTSEVDPVELDCAWAFMAQQEGQRLLPRTIRYIEDRRQREARYTGAIVSHPAPLAVVWGTEDPIAVVAMTERLAAEVPAARITRLEGVGHFPMLEAPQAFAAAVLSALG